MKIARIYIDQKNKRLDKPYDYLVPDEARAGMRTLQYFGTGKRLTKGFIIKILSSSTQGPLKEIESIIDREPVLTKEQIKLCLYMKQSFFVRFWEALSLFTSWRPLRETKSGIKAYTLPKETWIHLTDPTIPARAGSTMREVISILQSGDRRREEILKICPTASPAIRRLFETGTIRVELRPNERIKKQGRFTIEKHTEEKKAEEGLRKTFSKPLYLRKNSLRSQLTTLFEMLPRFDFNEEQLLILTPNAQVAQIASRYLKEKLRVEVPLLSSQSSQEEHTAFGKNIKNGNTRIAVGTPAAFFIPVEAMDKLTLIFLDCAEESYQIPGRVSVSVVELAEYCYSQGWLKQLIFLDSEESCLAENRCRTLGTWEDRTPKTLNDTPQNEPLCRVIHLDEELRAANRSILGRSLRSVLDETLRSGKRALFLLNRSGYARHLFCRECGYHYTCPDCGLALQTNREGHHLVCRQCGYQTEAEACCPNCGSSQIRINGMGTDRAKRLLSEMYPDYTVGIFPEEEQAQILIGTKQLLTIPSYESFGLAAGLLCDLDICFPDYRASEEAMRMYRRFFKRMIGEAGVLTDHLFLQTYLNDDPVLDAIVHGRHESFLTMVDYRRRLSLPPEGLIYVFTFTGQKLDTSVREAQTFHRRLSFILEKEGLSAQIMNIYRIRGKRTSCRFMLKTGDHRFRSLLTELFEEGEIESFISKVSVTVNPLSLRS